MKKLLLATLLLAPTAHAGEAEDVAALMLNLNGLLCAEVVDLRALKQDNVYEVQCVKYRGGTKEVTYILDMNSGNAWGD